MEGRVDQNIQNGIATISFYHPQSNSLPGEVLRTLASTITEVSNHPDTKVIVLKSDGDKTFCAGASFDELISIQSKDEGLRFFTGFAQVINAMRTSSKLIIGRVQGKAVGGGVGLASSCDYCFAMDSASVAAARAIPPCRSATSTTMASTTWWSTRSAACRSTSAATSSAGAPASRRSSSRR